MAVVRGHPAEGGVIDYPLSRQRDAREWIGAHSTDAAQPARTRYRRLATVELPIHVERYPSSRYALLALQPETGRKHQLRRHLKHLAHPIIGDATHGKGRHNRMFAEQFGSTRLLLASTDLWIDHPVTGGRLHLHAPLIEDYTSVLAHLGWEATWAAWLKSDGAHETPAL